MVGQLGRSRQYLTLCSHAALSCVDSLAMVEQDAGLKLVGKERTFQQILADNLLLVTLELKAQKKIHRNFNQE